MSFILLGILNSQVTGAAGGADGFDLIETQTLDSSTTSVTFNNNGAWDAYQHLQIRTVLRADRGDTSSRASLRFNSDSTTSYQNHYLGTTGSALFSASNTPSYSNRIINIDSVSATNQTSGSFGVALWEITDHASTDKYKTIRFLDGQNGSFNRATLNSGAWRNTNALTSITIADEYGDFISGCRFSIYGYGKAVEE